MASDRPLVLILGAGINGAAIARELVLNRVPVCLVDAVDISYGATAYSSRLIHGGLRYLEYAEFDLVRESLGERTRLLQLAPQFVKPLELVIPVENRFGGLWQSAARFLRLPHGASFKARGMWLVRMGLWLYDRYARDPLLPRHRAFTAERAAEQGMPPLSSRFGWMCAYYDAQIRFPERFVVSMLHDARQAAAEQGVSFQLLTYTEASLDGGDVSLHDRWTGQTTALRPDIIINATGAWVDETLHRLQVPEQRLMGGTKGSHIVTFQPKIRELLGHRAIYAEAEDGRPFFILPFGQATLIGTTDLRYEGDPADAVATQAEIEYLVSSVGRIVPAAGLTVDDVALHYSGVRPLPFVPAGKTGAITRRHWLHHHSNGHVPLISVIGGKLTTCGSLARETTAAVLKQLQLGQPADTSNRIFPGAALYPNDEASVDRQQQRLAAQFQTPVEAIKAIWELHGTLTEAIFNDIARDPRLAALQGSLLDGTHLPLSVVRWTIRHEWARHVSDLVERRLMLLYDRQLTRGALRQLAEALAAEGVIASNEVDTEVATTAARLADHFGKRVL